MVEGVAPEAEGDGFGPVAEGEDDYNALVEAENAYEGVVADELGKDKEKPSGGEETKPADEEKPADVEKPKEDKPVYGDDDRIWKGWTKNMLIKEMENLNKEFETKGFNKYAKLIAKASTPEEIQEIIDAIGRQTGVTFAEFFEQDGGPDAPDLGELAKQEDKEKAEKEKLAKEQAEKEGRGKEEAGKEKPSNPAVDTSNVKDMPKGGTAPMNTVKGDVKPVENATTSGGVSGGLAQTGLDGGILTGGLIAGLVGLFAKSRKGERE